MNKTFITTALAGFALLSSAFGYDGKVNISDALGFGNGQGGAYKVKITAGLSTLKADGNNEFLSFCIERNEFLLGGIHDANVSNAAVNGGFGGGSPDPLSLATAWLYSTFRAGNLAAQVFAATGTVWAQDDAGGNALQDAFWWLENEAMGDSKGTGVALIDTAKSVLGLNDVTARTTHANGAYGVRALNLYNGSNNSGAPDFRNQDLLALVPEPSTYVAAALLLIPVVTQVRRMRRSA